MPHIESHSPTVTPAFASGQPRAGTAVRLRTRRRRRGPGRGRLAALAVTLMLLTSACSGHDAVPEAPGSTVAAATPATDISTPALAPLERSGTEARDIVVGSGAFPAAVPSTPTVSLPGAVDIGAGRMWVPWPQYASSGGTASRGGTGSLPAVTGSQSALRDDMSGGHRHVVAQRFRWEAMPPYLADARAAFADDARVARRRGGTETAWELVVDPTGLDYETHLAADRAGAFDHVSLCPPHPTAEALGIDVGSSAAERDRAAAVIEAVIGGMRSPGGRPIHSWGTTVNDVAKLLVYSPGEPMELALGGHSLADLGYFPGDWSAQAKRWLTRRAAQGAVTDSLVGHAVVSTGPATLWEACSDLATIVSGVYTASHRTQQLESLWARGLRLEFTTPPVERAWVADLSAAGHALAVVCHPPGRSYLVDAATGERLDAGVRQPAQAEAMWLTWSRLSYRVLRNALFEGGCGGEAFSRALEWLEQAKRDHAADIDWTQPHAWGSGVRNQWVAVREWVEVSQAEAWRAHRDHGWHLAFWCRTGIPVGVLADGKLVRPSLAPHCTPQQWEALTAAAASAPEVTSELSATNWSAGATWHERMYLSPFKSLEQVLGCPPDDDVIAEALERPPERRVKKPWPPGSLPLTEPDRAYPRPMPPCPQAGWPPQTDRFWWPETEPLPHSSSSALPSAGSASAAPSHADSVAEVAS